MSNQTAKMLAEKAEFVPDKGFNLVGLDDFQPTGEKLYLIGHFTSKSAAHTAMTKRAGGGGDIDRMFIYGPDDA